jgi:SPP1 gp7 family putative phage head morphogenesis protein
MAKFEASRAVERRYGLILRQVARVVGAMVNAHVDGPTIRNQEKLKQQLELYSQSLGPWAEKVAADFIAAVNRDNKKAWASQSKKLAAHLKNEMANSSVGLMAKQLQAQQVALIQSIPLEAGARAQKLAQEAAMGGKRADEVAAELADTEGVTASRATLIARTEISKANAAITQARSEYVGATHYIWRTAGDGDVRESHREVDGKIFAFMAPPTLSDGMTGNPGEFPNCRCFAEPIIPE